MPPIKRRYEWQWISSHVYIKISTLSPSCYEFLVYCWPVKQTIIIKSHGRPAEWHKAGNRNVTTKYSDTYLCVIETGRSIADLTTVFGEYTSRSITWLLRVQIIIAIVIEIIACIGHANNAARQPGE